MKEFETKPELLKMNESLEPVLKTEEECLVDKI